jgi:hypothetical protein
VLHLMEQANDFIGTATQISALLTPYLPLVGIVVGGVIVGVFQVWNRRRGAVETKAPDVNEIWQQQIYQSHELDTERKWRRRLENFAHELVRVFRAYVNRVQSGGSTELTHHEKLFYDTDPPTSEINISDKK